ncbi:MAG: hypothetical protein LBJ31_00680 [Treponema sp.]|jgi:hypothetical protein|nr:hypothetical protein [Treponema sp.]
MIRLLTDTAIDITCGGIHSSGEKALITINAKAQRSLAVSAVLNGIMLFCAAISAIFLRELKGAGILLAALINYAVLARALFSFLRFCRTILIPYRKIISFSLLVFLGSLRTTKSVKFSIQDTILFVIDYFYEDKVPSLLKAAHRIASDAGFIKNRDEIKDMAVTRFYPLICRFLRVVLLYNILLFSFCYGLLVFIAKRFVIGTMLSMNFVDLYAYPFVYTP